MGFLGLVTQTDYDRAVELLVQDFEERVKKLQQEQEKALRDLETRMRRERMPLPTQQPIQIGGTTTTVREVVDQVISALRLSHPYLFEEPAAVEPPPAPRLEEVESGVVEEIADRVYDDVDTERIEEALATLLAERVLADLNAGELRAAIAEKYLESYADTDALQEQVSEAITERLEVRLRRDDGAVPHQGDDV